MNDGLFNPEAFEQMPGQMSMEACPRHPLCSGVCGVDHDDRDLRLADVLKAAGIGGKLAEIAEEPNPWL